jgi:hypothetical protein
METETEAELQGLEQDHTYEVEHGPGLGPFFDDEASHVSEFRTKKGSLRRPLRRAFLAKYRKRAGIETETDESPGGDFPQILPSFIRGSGGAVTRHACPRLCKTVRWKLKHAVRSPFSAALVEAHAVKLGL